MHLKQPDFTYSACGPFTKNKEKIRKIIQKGNANYILILIKLVFNMIWLMVNIKIWLKEYSQIKF